MKRLTFTLAGLVIIANVVMAQIGIDNPAPDPKASLDIQATNKGLLVPRLTTGERMALGAGDTPESLLVYDTDLHAFFYYYNTEWYCLTPFNLKITTTVPKDAVMDAALVNGVAINTTLNLSERFAVGGNVRVDSNISTGSLSASGTISTTANATFNTSDTNKKFSADGATGYSGPVPPGFIGLWSGSISGNFGGTGLGLGKLTGWALCNGQNGTPDLRDRFIVGAGSGYSVGATGGEATHVLTTAEMPSHNHTGTTSTNGNHTHLWAWGLERDDSGTGGSANEYTRTGGSVGDAMYASGDHQHTFTTDNTGGGAAHENRPPYYALAYIMKL